ncbi:sensor histidine kinase [Francisella frigiditurris]|uniref:histidine kinase n=1 Tax=Francisella frigiditurris TaxID=1542390 RepID=A0A1J0KTI2_9GAMM|nr:HAMP domain-containing sensor histidine kinase [Francisella frigiditurris]APC97003.1 his Kinase A domain protein [Francisella frigiditurris]
MSSKIETNNIQRRYVISSSFKMAMLFTILLSFSLASWGYILYVSSSEIYLHIIPLSIAILSTFAVVIISFLISVFVVKKINQIANTAVSIVNTQDLSRRIEVNVKWDDLSNLAHVLNILLANIETLLIDIKNVSDSVAHDLRTPLTRLKNQLEDLDKTDPSENTYNALANCNHILDIFNSILKINHLEHGRQKLDKQKFDIAKVIDDAIELYQPMMEDKKIALIKDIKSIEISIDKSLIFQSIINILDNSLKYSDKRTTILINSYKKNNFYILEIIDEGIGVKEENLENIFNRFFREENSRSTKGNGLGLVLVKKVIELHGGKITAKNNNPVGLIIKIQLPIR